jgi:phosphatidate cytidylyltransferase
MTDTGAFFAGRQFGGAKLNPEISPAKTWSGAIGGLITGSLAGLVVWVVATPSPWWIGVAIAATVSIAGQFGDLGESAIKRHFRIKDR